MKKPFFKIALLAYWFFLTRSLLVTNPWTLFSENIASQPPLDLSFEPTSWLVHLLAYGTLGLLIRLSLKPDSKLLAIFFGIALLHGGLCEYLQGFIPGRWPNVFDLVSNCLGLMCSWVPGLYPLFEKLPSTWKTSQEKRAA